MLGSFVLSSGYYDAYYKKALQAQVLLKDAYNHLFKCFDLILSPVAPTTAYKLGENVDDPLKMYLGDITPCHLIWPDCHPLPFPAGLTGAAHGSLLGMLCRGSLSRRHGYTKGTDYHTKRPGWTNTR